MLAAMSTNARSDRRPVNWPDAKTKPDRMHLLSAKAEYRIDKVT